MENIIVAKNIVKRFNGKNVLDGVSFELKRNENIVLLGKSGEGKSVLLKTLVGLIEPDEGEITILGMNVTELEEDELIELRRRVGYLFQEGALYDFMNVEDNLAFSLKRLKKKKSHEEIKQLVETALNDVGLSDAIRKFPKELSGGMKKRIALARTLVLKPEIILYDEPTTGLDPATSKGIINLILESKEKSSISSITVTHDMICARLTADRLLILNKGVIGAEGSYSELEKSEVSFVKEFFK